jgi:hypothetical protein
VKIFSQCIMSSKTASYNPGLYPVKGQKSDLISRAGDRNQCSSLFLGTSKTLPLYKRHRVTEPVLNGVFRAAQ